MKRSLFFSLLIARVVIFGASAQAQQLLAPNLSGYELVAAINPDDLFNGDRESSALEPLKPFISPSPLVPVVLNQTPKQERFQWKPALQQSAFFLGLQHTWRFSQSKTRRNLHGPFFHDWVGSVANINGWGDGDNIQTNYIGHPMEGAISGYIAIQNDPNGVRQIFDLHSSEYWNSRLKALAWAAAYSTQFEIGLVSEATIGHVGLDGKTAGAVDLVVTPSVGFAWIVGEDAIDKHWIAKWEGNASSKRSKLLRVALNPNRSFANLLRLKAPWYRDTRGPEADALDPSSLADESNGE